MDGKGCFGFPLIPLINGFLSSFILEIFCVELSETISGRKTIKPKSTKYSNCQITDELDNCSRIENVPVT